MGYSFSGDYFFFKLKRDLRKFIIVAKLFPFANKDNCA